jgi:hypothetical protein
MIAAVAIGALPDLRAAAALAPPHAAAVSPHHSLDEAYERYREVVQSITLRPRGLG